jgi:hypothetical protein
MISLFIVSQNVFRVRTVSFANSHSARRYSRNRSVKNIIGLSCESAYTTVIAFWDE